MATTIPSPKCANIHLSKPAKPIVRIHDEVRQTSDFDSLMPRHIFHQYCLPGSEVTSDYGQRYSLRIRIFSAKSDFATRIGIPSSDPDSVSICAEEKASWEACHPA